MHKQRFDRATLSALYDAINAIAESDIPEGTTIYEAGRLFSHVQSMLRSADKFRQFVDGLETVLSVRADNRHEQELTRLNIR